MPIITNVDEKLLRNTKFPPEFNKKVDTSKINIPVIKNWAAGEVSKLLGFDDDVVIGLLFGLLEGGKHPDIKSLQIQLAGFLGDNAPKFCKKLWNLCLSAQDSETGVPQQLLEAKKLELIQEKLEQDQAVEALRKRREEDVARDREIESLRSREREDRGGRRGGRGGRDFREFHQDRRPPFRDNSRPPPPLSTRRHEPDEYRRPPTRDIDNDFRRPPTRQTDTYIPSTYGRQARRPRSRSPSPRPRRYNSDFRGRSRSPVRASYREENRRRYDSPPGRRRSPSPRYDSPPGRGRSPSPQYRRRDRGFLRRSPSPLPERRARGRDRSLSESPPRRRREDSGDSPPPRPRRRSPPSSSVEPANVRKDDHSSYQPMRKRRYSRDRTLSRSRSRSPRRDRRSFRSPERPRRRDTPPSASRLRDMRARTRSASPKGRSVAQRRFNTVLVRTDPRATLSQQQPFKATPVTVTMEQLAKERAKAAYEKLQSNKKRGTK